MKKRARILIPVALGLMASACSTTSSTTSQSQTTQNASETSTIPDTTAAQNAEIEKQISEKDQKIASLEQQLADNNAQLLELHKSLDEKDKLIASLESPLSNAETLIQLEKEKRIRESLESQYAELKVQNDHLVSQIQTLETENSALKQKITADSVAKRQMNQDFLALNQSFQTLDSKHYALNQEYQALTKQHSALQQKYDTLSKENQSNQDALAALKKENLKLGGEISEARAQNQQLWDKIRAQRNIIDSLQSKATVTEDAAQVKSMDSEQLTAEVSRLQNLVTAQKQLITDYKNDMVKLEAALDENADSEAKIQMLHEKLAKLESMNKSVNQALANSQAALSDSKAKEASLGQALTAAQAKEDDLQKQLAAIQEQAKATESQRAALESQVNGLIPFQAEVNALQAQIDSGLSNVKWQVPNEMSLHNNFEILVTATVDKPVAGQTYVAELVTDSAIQMVSASQAEAVVQNGQLQWRWRVNGLNERPKAKLNLFISQQMNYQNQKFMRLIYRDSDTVALKNTNLLEKYGYWGGAILLGLLGGFLFGRINRKDKNA